MFFKISRLAVHAIRLSGGRQMGVLEPSFVFLLARVDRRSLFRANVVFSRMSFQRPRIRQLPRKLQWLLSTYRMFPNIDGVEPSRETTPLDWEGNAWNVANSVVFNTPVAVSPSLSSAVAAYLPHCPWKAVSSARTLVIFGCRCTRRRQSFFVF